MSAGGPHPTSPVERTTKAFDGGGDQHSPPVDISSSTGGDGGGRDHYLQRGANCLDHGLDIRQHIMIGKTQHTVLMLLAQPLCPRDVVLHLLRMRIAIDFNHQFGFRTEKIDDVRIDGVLLAEVCSVKLVVAQILPQSLFGERHVLAQLAGTLLHFFGRSPAGSGGVHVSSLEEDAAHSMRVV